MSSPGPSGLAARRDHRAEAVGRPTPSGMVSRVNGRYAVGTTSPCEESQWPIRWSWSSTIRRSEMPLRGYLAGVACGRLSRETNRSGERPATAWLSPRSDKRAWCQCSSTRKTRYPVLVLTFLTLLDFVLYFSVNQTWVLALYCGRDDRAQGEGVRVESPPPARLHVQLRPPEPAAGAQLRPPHRCHDASVGVLHHVLGHHKSYLDQYARRESGGGARTARRWGRSSTR